MIASAPAAAARRAHILVAPTLLLSLCGCAVNWSERTTGTAIGAVGGGVAGGLLGSAVGSTVGGVILGSAAGAAAGYIIGDYLADRRERNAGSGGTPTASAPTPRRRASAYDDPEDAAPPADLGPVVPAPAEDVVARSAAGNAVPVVSPPSRASRDGAARREYEAGRRAKTDAEALAHYDAAMRIDPSRPEPHNARGLVLLHMGRRADARRAFAQSLAVDPSYAPARANIERLDGK